MKHAPLAALPVAAMLVVAGVYGAVESRRSEAPVAEAQSRARQAAQQAVPQTIFVKPWDKYIECGVQQRDLRCLLYTSPSPRDKRQSRMPSSA